MPETFRRGGLAVEMPFYDVFWNGLRQDGIPRRQRQILAALLVRGEASLLALEMLTSTNKGGSVVVHITALRRHFERLGIPAQIKNSRNVGYRLIVEA